jgi:hypothetical protein
MKINQVQFGLVTLSLTIADCRQLARACDAAATAGGPDADALETIAAAFHALALAAQAQLDVPVAYLPRLDLAPGELIQ